MTRHSQTDEEFLSQMGKWC